VDDAQTVAKELGIFTAQDILNLEVGQAIARVGGSSAAFNLVTYTEPPAPIDNPSRRIIASTRQRYAKPRLEVEQELAHVAEAAERLQDVAHSAECKRLRKACVPVSVIRLSEGSRVSAGQHKRQQAKQFELPAHATSASLAARNRKRHRELIWLSQSCQSFVLVQ